MRKGQYVMNFTDLTILCRFALEETRFGQIEHVPARGEHAAARRLLVKGLIADVGANGRSYWLAPEGLKLATRFLEQLEQYGEHGVLKVLSGGKK